MFVIRSCLRQVEGYQRPTSSYLVGPGRSHGRIGQIPRVPIGWSRIIYLVALAKFFLFSQHERHSRYSRCTRARVVELLKRRGLARVWTSVTSEHRHTSALGAHMKPRRRESPMNQGTYHRILIVTSLRCCAAASPPPSFGERWSGSVDHRMTHNSTPVILSCTVSLHPLPILTVETSSIEIWGFRARRSSRQLGE